MSSDFDERVRQCLAEGLGVEDIAVKFLCHPELVRRAVNRLRERGVLNKMWKRSAK